MNFSGDSVNNKPEMEQPNTNNSSDVQVCTIKQKLTDEVLKSKSEETDCSFSYPKYNISKACPSRHKRHPLGMMQNTMVPSTPPSRYAEQSPNFILRQKQWRRMQCEKIQFNLAESENMVEPSVETRVVSE